MWLIREIECFLVSILFVALLVAVSLVGGGFAGLVVFALFRWQ